MGSCSDGWKYLWQIQHVNPNDIKFSLINRSGKRCLSTDKSNSDAALIQANCTGNVDQLFAINPKY